MPTVAGKSPAHTGAVIDYRCPDRSPCRGRDPADPDHSFPDLSKVTPAPGSPRGLFVGPFTMTQIKFTADLLALMSRRGLCEARAADLLGVPLFTLRKWTAAQRAPSAAAVRLLEVLGLLEALAPALLEVLEPAPLTAPPPRKRGRTAQEV